jgi:hypothetical protein
MGLFQDIRICFFFQSAELQHDITGAESRLQRRGDCQAVSMTFTVFHNNSLKFYFAVEQWSPEEWLKI